LTTQCRLVVANASAASGFFGFIGKAVDLGGALGLGAVDAEFAVCGADTLVAPLPTPKGCPSWATFSAVSRTQS
jgi:hypothetical protein